VIAFRIYFGSDGVILVFLCSGVLEGEACEAHRFRGGLGTVYIHQPRRRQVSFSFFYYNLPPNPKTKTEMAIFWNTHGRITPGVAQAHIADLLSVLPPVALPTPFASTPPPASNNNDNDSSDASTPLHTRAALDTPDEHALRALLLGIMHRVAGHPSEARVFLRDAHTRHANIPSSGSTWIGGVALFELAVLELREAQRLENEDANASLRSSASASETGSESEKDSVRSSRSSPSLSDGGGEDEREVLSGGGGESVYGTVAGRGGKMGNGARGVAELRVHVGAALGLAETTRARWVKVLKEAGALLDAAIGLSGSEVDLSSRLESRVAMTRDEIALKREMLGGR
jgi:hypothetical protein